MTKHAISKNSVRREAARTIKLAPNDILLSKGTGFLVPTESRTEPVKALVRDLLVLDMRLEGRACEERAHVIQENVNVGGGNTDRDTHTDVQYRVPSRGKRTGQGVSPGKLARRTAYAGKYRGWLGSRPKHFRVVFYRNRFVRSDISDVILGKGIGIVGLCID